MRLPMWGLFAAAVLSNSRSASGLVDEAIDIIKLAVDVGSHVFESWDYISKHTGQSEGVDIPFVQRMQRKILTRVAEVSRQVSALDLKVDIVTATTLSTLMLRLPQAMKLELRLSELSDLIVRVKTAERRMQEYIQNQDTIERATLENFAQWAVSHEPGAIPGLVERIHALVVSDGGGLLDRGILGLLVNSLKRNMKAALWLAVCLLASGSQARTPSIPEEMLSEVDALRASLLRAEEELWQKVADERWQQVTSETSSPDVEIIKVFEKFGDEADVAFPPGRPSGIEAVEKIWVWDKLAADKFGVDKLYDAFRRFQSQQTTPGAILSPHQAWLDLVETILLDPKNSVPSALAKMHEVIIHGDVFRRILTEANSDLCSLQQSPNQLLYNMYNSIALTEIKGYAMMQFSWMLLKVYGKGNFTQEANLMKSRYETRVSTTITAVKAAMENASRAMWKCDPPYHEEGETFAALKRLLQGYVENEVDMNPDGTCKENCAYYTLTKNHGCYKDQFCSRQAPCEGKIISCQYIDSDMWICPATRASDRRYEWIEYENGRTLGKKGTCLRGESKVESWWRWGIYHCSYCFCFCDALRDSERHFSMQESTSDVDNNKVVTGLRLNKVNGVIYLQVNEGFLLPRGNIDPASMRWVPVTPIDVRNPNFISGVDYHTMSYEERAIDLDDLEGKEGQLLTGVRFRKVGSHLNFEIMTTPCDFATGKLQPKEKSIWISNDNTDAAPSAPRKQLLLKRPDIPTRSPGASLMDSAHDQYLEFTHSDLDADAAQTTVPFLDIQPVLPAVPVPLTGAGVFHKGADGYGGFVAVKVINLDFSKHMQAGVVGEVVN